MAHPERDEPESSLVNLPPTTRQTCAALIVSAAVLIAFACFTPFASTPLAQLNAFFPALDAIVFIADLVTAVLLFTQFASSRSCAVLALANGYLFTALIVVPHALTFAGAFSTTGLLGAGLQTGSWLFIFWHLGYGLSLVAYALLRDEKREGLVTGVTPVHAIGWSAAAIFLVVSIVTWLTTAGEDLLPIIVIDKTRLSHFVVYPIIITIVITVAALVLLLFRVQKRSLLDQWLAVVALVFIAELVFSGLLPSIRFSLGFYVARIFSLITTCIVLIVLLEETARLHVSLAHSNFLIRRERDNKLMSLDAVAASISHEISQPLGAIGMNAEAALLLLGQASPSLETVRSILLDVVADTRRAHQTLQGVRALFGRTVWSTDTIDLNATTIEVAHTFQAALVTSDIDVRFELESALPAIIGNRGQIQEIILNLAANAIEAMRESHHNNRLLTLRTGRHGNDVMLQVEDTGPGLDSRVADNVFEAFVTTKPKGLGLGLAICQTIVVRHGGQITASAVKPRGLLVTITLPVSNQIT